MFGCYLRWLIGFLVFFQCNAIDVKCTTKGIFTYVVVNNTLSSPMDSTICTGKLTIKNTNITSIEYNAFRSLNATTHLVLQGGNMTSLPANAFEGMIKLAHLNLNGNNLTAFGPLSPSIKNIKELNLKNNQISTISDTAFDSYSKLLKLDLSQNQFDSLKPRLFDALTALTALLCSLTKASSLKIVDNNFDGLKALRILQLQNNKITGNLNIFANLPELVNVRIEQNKLTSVNGGFSNNKKIVSLWAYNNQLTTAPSVRSLTALKSLRLTENRIAKLTSNSFIDNAKLTELTLASNSLSELSGDQFSANVNLTKLLLHRNSLDEISTNTFSNNYKLTYLDLSENDIYALEAPIFDSLSNLETLYLQKNVLKALPVGLFDELKNLKTFNLGSNVFGCCDIPGIEISGFNITCINYRNAKVTVQTGSSPFVEGECTCEANEFLYTNPTRCSTEPLDSGTKAVPIPIIAGAAAGILFLVICVGICIFFYMRRTKERLKKEMDPTREFQENNGMTPSEYVLQGEGVQSAVVLQSDEEYATAVHFRQKMESKCEDMSEYDTTDGDHYGYGYSDTVDVNEYSILGGVEMHDGEKSESDGNLDSLHYLDLTGGANNGNLSKDNLDYAGLSDDYIQTADGDHESNTDYDDFYDEGELANIDYTPVEFDNNRATSSNYVDDEYRTV